MGWRVEAIRGAITVEANTVPAMTEAVNELLDELLAHNPLEPEAIINVIFTVTPDLDAMFPAKVARDRSGWDQVPLLDVQQMQVVHSLPQCIRILVQFNTLQPRHEIKHIYLRGARNLRPDLC